MFVSEQRLLPLLGFEPPIIQRVVLYLGIQKPKQITNLRYRDRLAYGSQNRVFPSGNAMLASRALAKRDKKKSTLTNSQRGEAERVLNRYNTFLAPSQGLFCHFTPMTSYLGNPRNEHALLSSRKITTNIHTQSRCAQYTAQYTTLCSVLWTVLLFNSWPGDKYRRFFAVFLSP